MNNRLVNSAVAAWGIKGWYDYIRPVSAIRYMADRGQCSDPMGPSYDVEGINLPRRERGGHRRHDDGRRQARAPRR